MIDLRAATPDDAAAIAQLYAPYVVTNAVSFEDKPPTAREMKARIAFGDGLFPWIVATDQDSGIILGYAYAKPFKPGTAFRFVVEVAVYAAGELEGKGIKRSLLSSLIATLTAQDFTQAISTLTTPNDKLIQLYESGGFRRAGAYREVSFKGGHWFDVGLWQRELAEPGTPPEEPKLFASVGVVRN